MENSPECRSTLKIASGFLTRSFQQIRWSGNSRTKINELQFKISHGLDFIEPQLMLVPVSPWNHTKDLILRILLRSKFSKINRHFTVYGCLFSHVFESTICLFRTSKKSIKGANWNIPNIGWRCVEVNIFFLSSVVSAFLQLSGHLPYTQVKFAGPVLLTSKSSQHPRLSLLGIYNNCS